MFTRQQIEAAHAKVKSGADFPKLVKELRQMGVMSYEHFVSEGSNVFYGDDDYSVSIQMNKEAVAVANSSSTEKLTAVLHDHRQGQTDYHTFCVEAGKAGVQKWVIDMGDMTATYLDKTGAALLTEPIPKA
ncbi:DUF1398 family protein [uncultured Chitinophaga sp.]|uniref:DUF1398 domain-containing protein n=1 Tax=uncultured Chitinophaga sp. TaxID=339340 RepID=UPI0025D1E172|nr:DUF1398 family protein [uncultured Chitinophaga sp.]